ncbi:unnamed protein product [Lupinus luteus]|uniref:Uncharacterized protein n=1 Tax=Lupinus luteus TaxID=3873 RepID=A0AAV1Y717_LUPLU
MAVIPARKSGRAHSTFTDYTLTYLQKLHVGRMSFQYEPLHRHQSYCNIGHRHSFSTQENEFMNTLFAANAGTPDSANVFLNDMNFNFNQGDGAGPSSFPIEENIFPTQQTNTTEDQTRVQRRDVPRRTRRPCRRGTGSHFGDV